MSRETILEALKGNEELHKEAVEFFGLVDATEKIKKAKDEIEAERETLKLKNKERGAKLTEMEEKLKQYESGGSAKDAYYKRLATDFDKLKGDIEAERQARTKAEMEARESRVSSAFVDSLTKANAHKPHDVLALMKVHGYIKPDETGEYKFYRKGKGGDFETAKTPDEAVSSFLGENQEYVKPSGTAGSGSEHGKKGNPGGGFLENPTAALGIV